MNSGDYRPGGLWAALRGLRAFWVAAGLLLVLDLALRPLVFAPQPHSLDPLRAQATAPQPAPTILLGSSRFRRVDAAHVEAAAPGAGLRNLAFNGGTLDAMWALTRRYLPGEVLRAGGTRLALIGIGVMDLNDGYRNALVAADTWGWGDFFAHVLDHGTDAETRLFLFERPPLVWSSLATAYRKSALRGQVRGLALRLTGRLQGPAAAPPPAPGDDVLENTQTQRAKGARSLAEVPPPLSSVYLQGFAVGGRQRAALRALVAHLHAHGVAVALVEAPVSDWYAAVYRRGEQVAYRAALRAEARALDVPVFLLSKADFGLTDADYFGTDGGFDGHHLVSAEGRRRFAAGLGAQVIAPLQAALATGRPVGFGDSVDRAQP